MYNGLLRYLFSSYVDDFVEPWTARNYFFMIFLHFFYNWSSLGLDIVVKPAKLVGQTKYYGGG